MIADNVVVVAAISNGRRDRLTPVRVVWLVRGLSGGAVIVLTKFDARRNVSKRHPLI